MNIIGSYNKDYFIALLILLPGFLSYEIVTLFSNTLKFSEFETIAACFTFSLVNYFIAVGLAKIYFYFRKISTSNFGFGFFSFLIMISIVSGLGATWVADSDVLFKIGLMNRVSLNRPVIRVIRDCKPVQAKVYMLDGRIYRGHLKYYSGDNKLSEFVLHKVIVESKPNKNGETKMTPINSKQHIIIFGKDTKGLEILPYGKRSCKETG